MKILLIEDDPSLAELLSEYLGLYGYEVEHRGDGQSGLDAALSMKDLELVLLDIMLPVMDGLEVLKNLRKHSELPVLMLTARGDDLDKVIGLELGADDYLAKPFNDRELLARIRAITRRTKDTVSSKRDTTGAHAVNMDIGDLHIDPQRMEIHCHGKAVDLTGSEYAILKYLAQTPGELLSKADISEHCLGRRLQAFDRSIDTHISNIRKKLTSANSDIVIKSQRGRGYGILC